MTTINFYLSNKNSKTRTSIIVKFNLNIYGQQKAYKFSSRESIKPSHWDIKRQRPKTTNIENKAEYLRLRKKLEKISGHILDYIPTQVEAGVFPTSEAIKAFLDEKLNPRPKIEVTFLSSFYDFIEAQSSLTKQKTIIKYKGLLKSLLIYKLDESGVICGFSPRAKLHIVTKEYNKLPPHKKLTFESIDIIFYDKYKSHLLEQGLVNDSIGKNFSTLKSFMEWSRLRGHHNNLWHKHPKFKAEKKFKNDNFVLTEEQLTQFFQHDFIENPILERIRDLFCFMCYTGQRWEDYTKFDPDDVVDNVWSLHISKTKEESPNHIPMIGCLAPAMNILTKYKGELPKDLDGSFFSHGNFNHLVKIAATEISTTLISSILMDQELTVVPLTPTPAALPLFGSPVMKSKVMWHG